MNGIIEIANWDQANADPADDHPARHRSARLRAVVIRRRRPGAVAAVMDLIGMKACIVPPNPGNLSAFGLLAVDWRTDHIITKVMARGRRRPGCRRRHLCGPGAAKRRRRWSRDGIERARIRLAARSRCALCRPVHGGARAGAGRRGRRNLSRSRGRRAFHAAHRKTFGYNYAGQQKVEIVNFCVSGFGTDRAAAIAQARCRAWLAEAERHARRSISTAPSATRRFISAPRCAPGFRIDGPAVVEEFGSTTVVFPGQWLEVDPARYFDSCARQSRRRRGHEHPSGVQRRKSGRGRRRRSALPRHRSHRPADRRRHAQLDRGRDRIRHRAHGALADDPRSARLSRRAVRSLLPQAHRAILFGNAQRGSARLPARDHEAGRRLPDERHLPHRGLDRPFAGPVQHGAGVS